MRFLLDADLPRSAADVVRDEGHDAHDVRDLGLGAVKDPDIARYARDNRLCLVTGDFDFADIRNYPPAQYFGLVVLVLPKSANASYINLLLHSFLRESDLLSRLPGRLAIVEATRVRLR